GLHLGEGLVAQDPGVVDEDVDPAPRVDDAGDHLLHGRLVGDVASVDHGLATGGGDLVDDQLGGGGGPALAVDVSAEVVYDDLGSALCQCEGVGAAEATPGAGDDRDAVGEVDRGHGELLFEVCRRLGVSTSGGSSGRAIGGGSAEFAPDVGLVRGQIEETVPGQADHDGRARAGLPGVLPRHGESTGDRVGRLGGRHH